MRKCPRCSTEQNSEFMKCTYCNLDFNGEEAHGFVMANKQSQATKAVMKTCPVCGVEQEEEHKQCIQCSCDIDAEIEMPSLI